MQMLSAVQVRRMAHDKIDLFCASEGFPTRDSLHAELAQAVTESRQDQWLVAQIDERVVGYSQIECWPEGNGTWVYLTLGWVLPERRQASPVTYRTRRATPAVKKDSALHPHLS